MTLKRPISPIVRTGIAIVAGTAFLTGAWISARAGISRLLSKSSTISGSLPVANEAVRLAPSDAESHRARGGVLRFVGQLPEAEKEYETAVSLRPLDDLLWFELGTIRDELENTEGALAALNESVRTAPFYAHPKWQRGNVLLRAGRYDEAFDDLRQAAKSNHDFQPNFIDLAWSISRNDPKLTEQILQIDDDQMRLPYARFLARKGLGVEALNQLRAYPQVSDEVRREIVTNLIAKHSYKEAYAIWSTSQPGKKDSSAIVDGGFESPLSFDEIGFGWRVTREEGVALSIDTVEKQSGSKSLRIQFNANPNAGVSILSQLVPVEPTKRYRISFNVRTQELVTGGLPVVTVTSANNDTTLAKSALVKSGTNDWQVETFDFTAGAETTAVLISLRRENCAAAQCPAFGLVWLDSFLLEQL